MRCVFCDDDNQFDMMMKTFGIYKLFALFSIVAFVAHAEGERPVKPNIVFILGDDMNRDSWGVYGSVDCKTPHIDRLAGEGVRFDRAYCSVAMCSPFRQELYSGRSPWRTGTLPNHSKSKPDTKSIAHYLKPLGYRVALLGKSHVGPKSSYPFEYIQGAGTKSPNPNPVFLKGALRFIDDCSKDKQPFCLFVASHDSHAPFTTGDRSVYDAASLTIPPYWLDTPELRNELVNYYAEVSNFDSLVGQMRAALEARGLWDSTIFMVCSEQGTQLPFAKWTCYDNGLHTGLVARWAGVTPAGAVAEELVSIADVTPTLVEAAGGKLNPDDCDGRSFLKMLKGKKQVLHPYVIGAFTNCNIIGSRDRIYPIRVLRNKTFSLIYNPNHKNPTTNTTLDAALALLEGKGEAPMSSNVATSWVELSQNNPSAKPMVHKLHHRPEYELYHLANDPCELKNEIGNPEYHAAFEMLERKLHAKLVELGDSDPIVTEISLVKTKDKHSKKKDVKH
jgi:N-sulfoglucosamine sulfohydrolase